VGEKPRREIKKSRENKKPNIKKHLYNNPDVDLDKVGGGRRWGSPELFNLMSKRKAFKLGKKGVK